MKKHLEEPSSWKEINYDLPLPEAFLIPPHHWPEISLDCLDRNLQIRFNHFLNYFMCEMFIHFERSIIAYIEIHKTILMKYLSESKIQQFISEELEHIQAFETLAKKIRPDLVQNGELKFLKSSYTDKLITKYAPVSVFFMMAFLFEEMTIFVPIVMEEKMEECFSPVYDVMRLHAKEEKGHVGMDRKIFESVIKEQSSIKTILEMNLFLPLIAISDRKVAKAWRKAAEEFAREQNLSREQTAKLVKKGLSKSDKMGISSFVQKLKRRPIPGTKITEIVLSYLSE